MKKVIKMLSKSFTSNYIQRIGKSYDYFEQDAEEFYKIHKTYVICSRIFVVIPLLVVFFEFNYWTSLLLLFLVSASFYCKWAARKILEKEGVRSLVSEWKEYKKIILGIPILRCADEGFRMVDLRDLIQFELDQRESRLETAKKAQSVSHRDIAKMESRVEEVGRLLARV